MQHATITSKGRKRKLSLDALTHLRTIPHGDQIETGTITVMIEGEEPSELVLPVSMIEALLEGIGAGPSVAPVEEPMAEPMEAEQAEGLDADDEDANLDAKTIRQFVTKIISSQLDARDAKRKKIDARNAKVHADAATILPGIYDYAVHWTQVAIDAIAKARPELEARARKLGRDAKTDPVAEGMLRQMLAGCRVDAGTNTPTTIVTKPKGDGAEAPAWQAPEMPARSTSQ